MSDVLKALEDHPRYKRLSKKFGEGQEPPDNGDMEARIAKLETAMEYVQRDLGEIKTDIRQIKDHARTDFRMLFGALIAVALGLAGLMAKGFHWL